MVDFKSTISSLQSSDSNDFFFFKLGEIVRGTQICNFFGKIQAPGATKIKKSCGHPRKNPENYRF
jgi:hypothetical protein